LTIARFIGKTARGALRPRFWIGVHSTPGTFADRAPGDAPLPKTVPIWAALVAVAVVAIAAVSGMFVYLHEERSSDDSLSTQSAVQQAQPPVFPRMQLQGQFSGPIVGTVIQRWRDPIDGTICYIYIPMIVQHKPAPSGYVQYGSNSVGSISCMTKGAAAADAAAATAAPAN
jgi:hypothetical protein